MCNLIRSKKTAVPFVQNDDWSMDHTLLWAASAPPTSGSWSLGVAGTIHNAFHSYTVLGELVDTLRRQLLFEFKAFFMCRIVQILIIKRNSPQLQGGRPQVYMKTQKAQKNCQKL